METEEARRLRLRVRSLILEGEQLLARKESLGSISGAEDYDKYQEDRDQLVAELAHWSFRFDELVNDPERDVPGNPKLIRGLSRQDCEALWAMESRLFNGRSL